MFFCRMRDLCEWSSLDVVTGSSGAAGRRAEGWVGGLRKAAESFVASGPTGVAVRTRLKLLAPGTTRRRGWSARIWVARCEGSCGAVP